MITGVSHITFIVQDLERAAAFFTAIFDAQRIYSSGDETFSIAREMFFRIGGQWICIMEGEPIPRSYNHVAFHVDEADFDAYTARVRAYGVDIRPERPRIEGEGRSIYFYDHDGHLFELHTGTLETRLAHYEKGK